MHAGWQMMFIAGRGELKWFVLILGLEYSSWLELLCSVRFGEKRSVAAMMLFFFTGVDGPDNLGDSLRDLGDIAKSSPPYKQ